MGWFTKLFGSSPKESEKRGLQDHLVRLQIPLAGGELRSEEEREQFGEIEDLLADKVDRAGVGVLERYEFSGNTYTVWFRGPQATPLAEVIRTALSDNSLPSGSTLFLRHGSESETDAPEETWQL